MREDSTPQTLACKVWVNGKASGPAVIADDRISFWGGFDPQSGKIVDPYAQLRGRDVTGSVLILLSSKGSSGTSGMLSLAQRAGHAPVAMVHVEVDSIAVLGCLVNSIPLLQPLDFDPFAQIRDGDWVEVDGENACLRVTPRTQRTTEPV
ncbi:aconitase X swivel domain-containing protein [Ottowia thiooxydans]|uniref:aconitase X swivel domain-containing protein n=1 Tax=Ottowia thiooxydans TaxID=219182 RepID=UPI0004296604|nr:DUF126 domain-containing protein [Ottowia thiooxydans]